jgi:hypothetical protein
VGKRQDRILPQALNRPTDVLGLTDEEGIADMGDDTVDRKLQDQAIPLADLRIVLAGLPVQE